MRLHHRAQRKAGNLTPYFFLFIMLQQLFNRVIALPPVATIRLFKAAIYGWLLINSLFLLPIAGDIWGPQSLITDLEVPPNFTFQFFYLLMNKAVSEWYLVFVFIQLAAIVFWFSGKWQRVASIVIYLLTAMLFLRAYLYVTGGHRLVLLFLFFFIFIDEKRTDERGNVFSNLFFLACKIQLLLVYLYAGLFKLHGTYWLNGEALYYVLNLREFSHPLLQGWLLQQYGLLAFGTYVALAYQLLFPVLVWVKPLRWPFLAVGIAFHLMVAIALGLPDFGLLMVLSYTMFVGNQLAEKILNAVRFYPRIQEVSNKG
jgi:hypothetical protein